jgi:glycosyltransferase involved in cell wall biosynthesis
MINKRQISIYVRNKDITPSSYYRIVQYAKYFDGDIQIREIAPRKLYEKRLNSDENKKLYHRLIGIFYYIVMLFRATFYLLIDWKNKPQYLIVSKTFCPRYTPLFLGTLIKKVVKSSTLYWDFDDYIFESGEISKIQASILEMNSKAIVVTSDFLRSKINAKYHNKVILLPTTDGDLQGFDEAELKRKRRATFNREISLVWVATAGNIPNLLKIIDVLDKTAAKLKREYYKDLTLVVVCNKPVEIDVIHLKIRNIKWSRDSAKEEIYNAHIGIMPLIHREYALGKGGFKLVQYISTGLPVIASNIGFNIDVVDKKSGFLVDDKEKNDDWLNAIIQMAISWEVWEDYSVYAYRQWNSKFSYTYNLGVWKDLLQK